MTAPRVYACILAGGTGERFWPHSRAHRPKQVLPITGRRSMIEETRARVAPLAAKNRRIFVADPVTARIIRRRMPGERIIEEPCSRNTAAAIGLACVHVLREDPGALMLVTPADHYIGARAPYLSTVRAALRYAREHEGIVTIGIVPTFPSTGYGYIRAAGRGSSVAARTVLRLERFIEKPDARRARRFVSGGGYFWNSGMFIFKASVFLDELRTHLPRTCCALERIAARIGRPGYRACLEREYRRLVRISVDHAVMEKTQRAFVLPGRFDWDDVGVWATIARFNAADNDGNVCVGKTMCHNAEWNILVAGKGHLVAAANVKGLIVVHTPDATLVCDRRHGEQVRGLVERLKRHPHLFAYT